MPETSANPDHNDGLAQPNPGTRPVGSFQVPLSKVHANPKNPRRVITLEMIDNMAASLQAVGLKNPIKLNVLPDGSYELISGHIRFAGAQRLGWETIPAELLTLAPDQALLESILDNRGQPMNWLETAEAVESLMQARPKPGQEAVGKMVGINQDEVSRKMAVLKYLNPASRALIYEKSIKGSENGLIPQKTVAVLSALKDEDLVEKALGVAIARKMTEAEAQKLVTHVQAGNTPKSYTRGGAKASAPNKLASPTPHTATPSQPTSAPAQVPAVSETPEQYPNMPPAWLGPIVGLGLLWIVCWLAWKAVVWVVTIVIHWL